MVVIEDSANAHLLKGHRGKWKSDDNGNVEIVFDSEKRRDHLETSWERRSRILNKLRQKVARTVRSIGPRASIRDDWYGDMDKENTTALLNRSSYDQASILDDREGPPLDSEDLCDTFSTVSSELSTCSNMKRQRRLTLQWKSCMSLSIRKLLRKEMEDDMKGNPPKYHDFGLHITAEDAAYSTISSDRRRSAFRLLVPTLDSPVGSHDDATDECRYDNAMDFPLKCGDEIAFPVLINNDDVRMEELEEPKVEPNVLPRRSKLFVSFDEEMAQIIFQSASSETDDFQAVEVHSVESDIEVTSQDDDDEFFAVTFPKINILESRMHKARGSCRDPPGVSQSHDSSQSVCVQRRIEDEIEFWRRMNVPDADGELTDPPSPIKIETSREEYWKLGQMDSMDVMNSTTTMTTHNKTFVKTRIPSGRPIYPRQFVRKSSLDDFPYDEKECLANEEETHSTQSSQVQSHKQPVVQGWRRHVNSDDASAPSLDENHRPQENQRPRTNRGKVKCGCVKCTAKSIYQDLMGYAY